MQPHRHRRTPSTQSLIKRLIALVGREIGQMEARYDARDAAAARDETGGSRALQRLPRRRRRFLPTR